MVASPQTGENHIDFLKVSDELLNITYDDKPSAYTAISKYWKFIGGDFYGFAACNLDKLRFLGGPLCNPAASAIFHLTWRIAEIIREAGRETGWIAEANLVCDLCYRSFPGF